MLRAPLILLLLVTGHKTQRLARPESPYNQCSGWSVCTNNEIMDPGLCIYQPYTQYVDICLEVYPLYLQCIFTSSERHLNFSNAALSFEQIADSYSRWDGLVTSRRGQQSSTINNSTLYLQHFQTFEHCACWFALLCSLVYSVVLWENRHRWTNNSGLTLTTLSTLISLQYFV